ncbi:MAG: insulinase family protein [Bacteroidetes bacterium]|nr:insulinase family protein [Bacteroidota bacterium]
MKKYFLLLLASLALVSIQAQEFVYEPGAAVPLDAKVIYGTLDNGLTYYIRENNMPENRAEFYMILDAGAILEDDSQNGLAHFCEHMCFNGTEHFEKHEIINYLQSIGMKFGPEINAFTSHDVTTYMLQKVPTEDPTNIDTALLILFDWAYNVSFEDEEIDKERGVIHEEWRTRRGAQFRMMTKTDKVLYHGSKYAERDVIGDIDIIDNCAYEELKRFYNDWYRPDLQAVIAVGDFDADEMETHIRDLFSKEPVPVNPKEREIFEVPDHQETLVAIETDPEAQYNLIQLYWKHDPDPSRDMEYYRHGVLEELYSIMLNSRLQELIQQDDPPFMFAISMYNNIVRSKDAYLAFAVASNDKVNTALEAMLVENERVKLHGFTGTELERAKADFLRQVEAEYNERDKQESSTYVWEYYSHFLNNESVPGIEFDYEFVQAVMPEISLEELNSLAVNWITEENRVVVITGPESEDGLMPSEEKILATVTAVGSMEIGPYIDRVSDAPLLAEIPEPGTIKKKSKNKKMGTVSWELSNGVKVVFKQTDFKDEEILMSAYSYGGTSLYDIPDLMSAENCVNVVGRSGLAGFDEIELQKKLAGMIVTVYPYVWGTSEGFQGNCAPADFETMLKLVYLYFTMPRQDETAFNAFLSMMEGILDNRANNPAMALRDTLQVTMANYHPRVRPLTSELLPEIDFKKLHYIYNERFGDPGSFTFYFVGNIDPEEARPMILTYLGGLPLVKRNETWKDNGVRPPDATIEKTIIRDMEVPKGTVNINFVGVYDYDDPMARMELSALCDILDIRYTETIREEQGGTYGVRVSPSQVHYPWEHYTVRINFDCDPENVDKLKAIVFEEIEKMKAEGPQMKDLKGVKENLLKSRTERLKQNRFWLQTLMSQDFNHADSKYFFNYEDMVNSMSIESLKDAANKFFSVDYIEVIMLPSDKTENVRNPMLEEQ